MNPLLHYLMARQHIADLTAAADRDRLARQAGVADATAKRSALKARLRRRLAFGHAPHSQPVETIWR